jgi:predicted RNA methylase
MSLYNSRRDGLLRLRHLQEHVEAKGEEMEAERGRFATLAGEESKTRAVSSFNLFQTPEPLADRLAGLLDLTTESHVLEPSAGLGRLYRAVRAVSACRITLVEIAPQCCAELYRATESDTACHLVQGDFLSCDLDRLGTFDAILMNPPFKMGTDIKHIRHALQFLKPGGRLVSICAAGPRQRATLQTTASDWIDLPAGSFRSEGTDVAAAIVVFTPV